MSPQTTPESIQAGFAARCDKLLNTMLEQARDEDTWDVYLAKGAGDQAIAGDHEARHLLELLQNARDAIYRGRQEGNTTPGRVLILVTERGMAMANTGAPFRLDQGPVLKAVRFLMRSDKAGHGFVGHKGIGLKSILLRAGAFAVRSRLDGEVLRATFSRYRTAQYLLHWLETAAPPTAPGHYIRAELPRLPLFAQPHADQADAPAWGADTELLEALLAPASRKHLGLTDVGVPGALAPYTTVVYLPYREPEWEQLLDTLELAESYRPAFRQARAQMSGLARNTDADALWEELRGLDPRALVLLGEMAEVQMVRFQRQQLLEARRIMIESPLLPLTGRDTARTQTVHLHIQQWQRDQEGLPPAQSDTFSVLSTPTTLGVLADEPPDAAGPAEAIRILLTTPSADHPPQLKDEPLFLYYPIETSYAGVPFLIHGPFRVNSSRTALAPGEQAHNQAVLSQAVELLLHELPGLLKPPHPLRQWLPWIVLPLTATGGTVASELSPLQAELCQSLITRLNAQRCIPTSRGLCLPSQAHFLPEHPDALTFLTELRVGRKGLAAQFYLLDPANLATYRLLAAAHPERWRTATRAIGLGQLDLVTFAQELAAQLGRAAADPLPVPAAQAHAFFLSLCTWLSSQDTARNRQAAAEILGRGGVPLLPALPAAGTDDAATLLLVPTETRDRGGTALKQAGRVVFWRPASARARASDLPTPPPAIPIYFIDPAAIEAEGRRAVSILETYDDEWGVTRFDSRPDLFRRVADRTAQLDGKTALPVLGYLTGVLHQILTEAFSGAEDLRPRPYAALSLELVRTALDVANRTPTQRAQDRQRLESLQRWAQILIPIKGSRTAYAPAENAVFGPAWATLLEQTAPPPADADRPPEEGWAQAIRMLAAFRQAAGRRPTDTLYPEIADPDDPRWQPVLAQFNRVVTETVAAASQLALFRLLLLLGVRIGPRVAWRWLDIGQNAPLDDRNRSINLETSAQLWCEAAAAADILPAALAQSRLLRAYSDFLTMKPYHPAFAAEHSPGHREHLQRTGNMESHLAAWTWLPDLVEADLDLLPFSGDLTTIDAFRAALLAVWEVLSGAALKTGWYCAAGWHVGRSWTEKGAIPALAAFQLARLALWPAGVAGRLADAAQRRFPAAVMVAWEQEEAPTAADPAGFFPLLDARDAALARAAQSLGVTPLAKVDFAGAVLRLRWLLEESRVAGAAGAGWQIAEFPGSSRDAWLAAQYRLLEHIVRDDPKDWWNRRTARLCGLALRAVCDADQQAVPLVVVDDRLRFAIDVAFFSQSPRWWERRANAGRWILETRPQLQTDLYRWAEVLGATRLPSTEAPTYQGAPLVTPAAATAIHELQGVVQSRLAHLLGVFKAHHAEKLEELAAQLKAAMATLTAMTPAANEEGWSGLDAAGRLVFSLPAYLEEQQAQRPGAIVLAEGIALLVKQTTAVGDLQHALSAPLRQVERALKFQGVDLEALTREVSALEQRRIHNLLERVKALLADLRQEAPVPAGDSFAALTAALQAEALYQLQSLTGPLAAQLLAAFAAPPLHLVTTAAAALLRIILDEERFTQGTLSVTRALLEVLREADWSLSQRACFAAKRLGPNLLDLYAQIPACAAMVHRAVVAALIDQCVTGEWADDALPSSLAAYARIQCDGLLPLAALEPAESFMARLRAGLKLPTLAPETPRLLLELTDGDWEQWGQSFQEYALATLPQLPPAYQDWFAQGLREGTLTPLTELHPHLGYPPHSRLQTLERQFRHGELTFAVADLLDPPATPLSHSSVSAAGIEPGAASGGAGDAITEDQAARGRVAELFVLDVCWQRYLRAPRADRERVLNLLADYREHGAHGVAWGTPAAWKTLRPRLLAARDALLDCPAADSASRTLFTDLLEVTHERGPGFDVLDPFGVWGQPATQPPYRVEVKALLPPTKGREHRVVLSTNEFHRARQHPASYVLRLIYVPGDYEDVQHVRWAADIPDPVQTLRLDEMLLQGVRSGILPFKVHIE